MASSPIAWWNADPRLGAQQQIAGLPEVRTRMGLRPTEPAPRHTVEGTLRSRSATVCLLSDLDLAVD